MADPPGDGRAFRVLNVPGDFNREGPGIAVDFSQTAKRFVRSLDRIIEWRGKPGTVRHEWLDQDIIDSIEEVHDHAIPWRWTYNTPLSRFAGQSPPGS